MHDSDHLSTPAAEQVHRHLDGGSGRILVVVKYAALLAVICILGSLYVLSENGLYWSDYNWWFAAARSMRNMALTSPMGPLMAIWSTFSWKDNLLFALPILPALLLFGASRLAYILAVLVEYVTPYLVATAILACDCLGVSRTSFWTVLIVALIPAVWAPALRGLPDAAGAFLVTVAVLLQCGRHTIEGKRHPFWSGVLMAVASLIRRHFIFAVAAFVLSIALQNMILRRGASQSQRSELSGRAALKEMALAAAGFTLVLCTLGLGFVQHLLSHNYAALNSSYRVSIAEETLYFIALYGMPIWLMAIGGWIAALKLRCYARRTVSFVLPFSLLLMLLWLAGGRQISVQYTVYFNTFIAIGIVLLIGTAEQKLKAPLKAAIGALICLYLFANFIFAITPETVPERFGIRTKVFGMIHLARQEPNLLGMLFSASYPPNRRTDLDSIRELIDLLRRNSTSADDRIVVTGEGDELSADALWNAERKFYGDGARLQFIAPSGTDSIGEYPIEAIQRAQYVVIADPPPICLKPQEQRLIAVVNRCFEQRWPMAQQFAALPDSFTIENGRKVTVWKRIDRSLNPGAIVATLAEMTRFVGPIPGGQPQWITTGVASKPVLDEHRQSYTFETGTAKETLPFVLISARPVATRVAVSGTIATKFKPGSPAHDLSLDVACHDASGAPAGQTVRCIVKAGEGDFALKPNCSSGYVVLTIKDAGEDQLSGVDSIEVQHLQLVPR